VYVYSVVYAPSNTHVPSVLPPVMKHTLVPSLSNVIEVSVETHVNVKSSPIVALSVDVVSVKPETNRHYICLNLYS
jgi:hypothetical protein